MSGGLSAGVVSLVGAALAVVCLAIRVRGGRWASTVAGAASVVLAPAAILTGRVEVLALAWLGASVAVSGRDRPTDVRTAVGVLGDAVAAAGLAAGAVHVGEAVLPWTGGPPPASWVPVIVALGVGTRAVAVGMREPGLLVVGCVVAANLAGAMQGVEVPEALVALAAPALVVAWVEGPLSALPLLGGALMGVHSGVATEAATFVFAGAAAAASGVAIAGAPAVGGHWRFSLETGPAGGATAGGLALLAALPAGIGLLRIPVDRNPEVAVTLAATLVVLGVAGAALGARRLRPEAGSPRTLVAVAAGLLIALALLVPTGYAEALGLPGTDGGLMAPILAPGRGALLSAGAFALVGTSLVALAARRRAG